MKEKQTKTRNEKKWQRRERTDKKKMGILLQARSIALTHREKGIVQKTPKAGRRPPTGGNMLPTASTFSSVRHRGTPYIGGIKKPLTYMPGTITLGEI